MSKCRTGCHAPGSHESYAACLRAAGTKVAYANTAGGMDYTAQKKWDKELDFYRQARSDGIQPASTQTKDIRAAYAASESTGTAFQADM